MFENFNSDKGENYINQYQKPIKRTKEKSAAHKYHQFYEEYFYKLKNKKIDIFEIEYSKVTHQQRFIFTLKAPIYFQETFFLICLDINQKELKTFFR